VNDRAREAIGRFADRAGIERDAVRLALIGFPLGAVRLYLPERPVPESVDAHVADAYRAAVARGRR